MLQCKRITDTFVCSVFLGVIAFFIFLTNDAYAQTTHTSIGRLLCTIQSIMRIRGTKALGGIAIGIVAVLAMFNKIRLSYALLVILGIATMAYSKALVILISGKPILNFYCPDSITNTNITRVLCTMLQWFSGNLGSALSTIAICNLAAASLYGKINWGVTILTACGIAAIFAIPNIYESLNLGWICST